MRCSLKFIKLLTYILIFSFGVFVGTQIITTKPVATYSVAVYPAHLAGKSPNGELLFVDADKDVAYYSSDTVYKASVGDTVKLLNGVTCSVIEVSSSGFYIDYDAISGDSGMDILLGDTVVGYLSTKVDSNLTYCIWKIN